jgi:hypothetical protein
MGLDQNAFIGVITEKRTDPETGQEYDKKIIQESFYWRKHARLQEFMEDRWVQKTGRTAVELNCEDMRLTEEDINLLEKAILDGYTEHVSEGGMFYGHQFQEESVKEYREYDLQFVERARTAIADGTHVIYHCWW